MVDLRNHWLAADELASRLGLGEPVRTLQPRHCREADNLRKTAGSHIEHIYTKTGVRNRAGANLFAMRHGLMIE